MKNETEKIQKLGNMFVDAFHYLALFVIGGTVVWFAAIGVYFKTHRLPVQFLIFIAITALSRHLVIDVQHVSEDFHLYLLLSISGSIVILSGALFVLSFTASKYGRPEDDVNRGEDS